MADYMMVLACSHTEMPPHVYHQDYWDAYFSGRDPLQFRLVTAKEVITR